MTAMALDWLYGPSRLDQPGSPRRITLRSLKLEIDTVLEIAEIMRQPGIGAVSAHRLPTANRTMLGGEALEISALGDAPAWHLKSLYLSAISGPPVHISLHVFLDATGPAEVELYVPDPRNEASEAAPIIAEVGPKAETAFAQIVDKLQNEGRPRPIVKPWLLRLPWLAFMVMLGAWVWVVAGIRPPVSVLLFGTLMLGPAAAAAAWAQSTWRSHMMQRRPMHPIERVLSPGCQISTVTRRETRERRAATHAALRQFAVTAPVSAVIGVVGTLVAQRLT